MRAGALPLNTHVHSTLLHKIPQDGRGPVCSKSTAKYCVSDSYAVFSPFPRPGGLANRDWGFGIRGLGGSRCHAASHCRALWPSGRAGSLTSWVVLTMTTRPVPAES